MALSTMGYEVIEDEVLYVVDVVDIAATARKLYGGVEKAVVVFGRPLPAHDYRFQVRYGDDACNGQVTFHYGATANDVVAWLRREKLLPENVDEVRRVKSDDS